MKFTVVLSLFTFFLLDAQHIFFGVNASPSRHLDVAPADRAHQTLQGLFEYYWINDPKAKYVKFFSACGQIGDSSRLGKCSCTAPMSTPQNCVNCFRWWDAVAMEAVATYGIYSNTKEFAYMADTIFAHSPYNANWNATAICTYIDDFAWYAIAYLRVYEWLEDPKWLNRSIAIYNWTWENGWHGDCGGFWWNTCDGSQFKDSITNMEILHLAAKLSYMFPKDSKYLHDAQRIWNWFFSFDDGHGLMSDSYLVSTGGVPENCCNSTSPDPYTVCTNAKTPGMSYNQGLLMSASAFLYIRTRNETYLNVGIRALEAILANYTSKEGILVDEQRGFQGYQGACVGGADPGGDYYSFNGIFMQNLVYFTELLSKDKVLSLENLTTIKNFIQKTSDAAWTRSAVWPPFSANDVCSIGLRKSNATFPKFHWWWGEKVTKQKILPPDMRIWLHKQTLRCVTVGNNTQIWQGFLGNEQKCKDICIKNSSCSKYLYQLDPQSSVPGLDCWMWSYNRSDHICEKQDYNFNVGVMRPIGKATCAGKCGSKVAQKLKRGVCYCDADCVKHMDCCLDYADFCLPDVPITCKGRCNNPNQILEAQPVPGGGYCWCDYECNRWSTDNNSDSSCCPDYMQLCEQVSPAVCLDTRSQASALSLFAAHFNVQKIND